MPDAKAAMLLPYLRLSAAAYLTEATNEGIEAACAREGLMLLDRINVSSGTTETHCFVAKKLKENVVVIVFRGTSDWKDVLTDAEAQMCACSFLSDNCAVHAGFNSAYITAQPRIWEAIKDYVSPHTVFITTGHSLGAALATLCALDIRTHWAQPEVRCYSFASPKVGGKKFVDRFKQDIASSIRCVTDGDPVPGVPFAPYRHVTGEYMVTSTGKTVGWAGRWWRFLWQFVWHAMTDFKNAILKPHDTPAYAAALQRAATKP